MPAGAQIDTTDHGASAFFRKQRAFINPALPEIVFAMGWQSLGTFGRTFKDVTGESPSAIRASAQAESNQPGPVPVCFVKASQRPN